MVGMLSDFEFETDTVSLAPGDLLVIYSDGITEAFNTADEDFGEDRLMDVLKKHLTAPVQTVMEEILAHVRAFMGDAPQSDDMSLLIVRRDPS